MSLTFERKLPIILFFVFLMLTTAGVVVYQTTQSLQDTIDRQHRSQDVVSRVDETVALAFESYLALDNFLEVSNNTYLDPFDRAKPRLSQNIDRLRILTAERPAQLEETIKIDETLKQLIAGITRKVELRKSMGLDFPEEERKWGEGQRMIDQIRTSANRIKQLENFHQQQRELAADEKAAYTIWILILSSLAGIISLGLANLTVLSEIKKRRVAQNQLMQLNEGLERNVEDRTVELKRANEKLLEVGLERESILYSEKEARQEAEIANRLRDEFMATVSHELRTPLNSILGWARLMKNGSLDDAQAEKALSTIIKNSETQNRLIEDLLDVARVISGKLELDLVQLDPADVVSESIETVRPSANAKNIRIVMDNAPSNAMIEGDRNRLIQVFTNLLGNAIKFSRDGTTVHVSMHEVGESVITRIQDEGRGISEDFLPLVFERFRQDVNNKSNNGGLGLGLAIVRNLVEMHGGSVSAESDGQNKGSVFTVVLPEKLVVGREKPAPVLQDLLHH